MVDLCVANDIRFVTTSAGDPKLMIDRLHDAGITVFHVVGTLAAARKAVDAGVDAVGRRGVEGGGLIHRFGASTMVLLPLVAAHVDVPIVAASEICDARSMAAALVLGAKKACRWAPGCSPGRSRRYTATSSKRSSAPTRRRR